MNISYLLIAMLFSCGPEKAKNRQVIGASAVAPEVAQVKGDQDSQFDDEAHNFETDFQLVNTAAELPRKETAGADTKIISNGTLSTTKLYGYGLPLYVICIKTNEKCNSENYKYKDEFFVTGKMNVRAGLKLAKDPANLNNSKFELRIVTKADDYIAPNGDTFSVAHVDEINGGGPFTISAKKDCKAISPGITNLCDVKAGETYFWRADYRLIVANKMSRNLFRTPQQEGQTMLPNASINAVAADGLNVYVATNGGLAVSNDSGIKWKTKTSLDGIGSNFVETVGKVGDLAYLKSQPDSFGADSRIIRITDNGNKFLDIWPNIRAVDSLRFVGGKYVLLSLRNGKYSVLLATSIERNGPSPVLQSSGEVPFGTISFLNASSHILHSCMPDKNQQSVIICRISEDFGKTWAVTTKTSADSDNAYLSATSGNKLFKIESSKLWISDVGSNSFLEVPKSNSLHASIKYVKYVSNGSVIVVNDEGISISRDKGKTFTKFSGLQGADNTTKAYELDGKLFYVTKRGLFESTVNGTMFKLLRAGSFYDSYVDKDRMILRSRTEHVKTYDRGVTFNTTPVFLDSSEAESDCMTKVGPDLLLAKEKRLLKSVNDGVDFTYELPIPQIYSSYKPSISCFTYNNAFYIKKNNELYLRDRTSGSLNLIYGAYGDTYVVRNDRLYSGLTVFDLKTNKTVYSYSIGNYNLPGIVTQDLDDQENYYFSDGALFYTSN